MQDLLRDVDERTLRLARVCHEAHRAYLASQGDQSLQAWDYAPVAQQLNAVISVGQASGDPNQPLSAADHDEWPKLALFRGIVQALR